MSCCLAWILRGEPLFPHPFCLVLLPVAFCIVCFEFGLICSPLFCFKHPRVAVYPSPALSPFRCTPVHVPGVGIQVSATFRFSFVHNLVWFGPWTRRIHWFGLRQVWPAVTTPLVLLRFDPRLVSLAVCVCHEPSRSVWFGWHRLVLVYPQRLVPHRPGSRLPLPWSRLVRSAA